jgi:hypothetical protein
MLRRVPLYARSISANGLKAANSIVADRKKTKASQMPKLVNLALQGGGSHGAFTWGVLDRLLEEEALHPALPRGRLPPTRIAGLLAKSVRPVGTRNFQAFLNR